MYAVPCLGLKAPLQSAFLLAGSNLTFYDTE